MQVEFRHVNDVVIVDIAGDVDIYNSAVLKSSIQEQIAGGARNVLVNMEGVKYIDSSGVGVLIAIMNELNKLEGRIKLVHIYDAVRRVFELTRLTGLFDIYDSEEEAVSAF
ncbi:MAG: STAS domain-containing protein [Leptospiraceae bacterium]|nr:STAS domain-containing protein [Leptospiraceae bacterium]